MANRVLTVDLGTSYVTVGDGRSLVKRVPNVGRFTVNKGKLRLETYGAAAVNSKNGAELNGDVIRPVDEGVVLNSEAASLIVKELLNETDKKNFFDTRRVYVSISSGLTTIERDETEQVFLKAGYNDVRLVESVLALAPFVNAEGSVVAILGGGSFEAGVLNRDGIVTACSLNVGGETVNKLIIDRIFEQFKLKISTVTAEQLKVQIGSLYERDLSRKEISGRDVIDGKIKNIEITAEEIRAAVSYCYQKYVDVIESMLTTIPVTLLDKVAKNGLYIAGGGAEMRGAEDFFAKRLKMPVKTISEPQLAVARGLQILARDSKYGFLK